MESRNMKYLIAQIDCYVRKYPQCTANGVTNIYSSCFNGETNVCCVYKASVEFHWWICRSNVASSLFRSRTKKIQFIHHVCYFNEESYFRGSHWWGTTLISFRHPWAYSSLNTWMQNTMDGMNYIRKLGHFAAGKRSPTLAFSFASLADIFN